MRKLITLLVAVLLTATVWAQAPQKMSYQAVIRNSSNALLTSTPVGMQISILQGSSTGTAVYVETQTVSTNANGLVSLEIGTGTVITGTFSSINWATGPYFIKTETDPTGGTAYTIAGTNELMSVPYALFSANGTPGATGAAGTNGTNGLDGAVGATGAQGIQGLTGATGANGLTTSVNGITQVAGAITLTTANIPASTDKNYVTDANATKLTGIATGAEVNVQADWNQATNTADDYIKNKPTIPAAADGSETKVTAGTNVTVTGAGTTASPYVINSTASGSGTHYLGEEYLGGIIYYLYTDNTGTQKGLIVSKTESTATWSGSTLVNANKTSNGAYNMALMPTGAGTARTWVETLGAGWYLPSVDELSLLWHNRFHINNSSASGLTLLSTSAYYWSSTESNASSAFAFYSLGGYTDSGKVKTGTYSVRAVRAF